MATEVKPAGSTLEFLVGENNEQQLWAEVYTRQFPTDDEFECLTAEEQGELLAELREEVELLDVEAGMMQRHAESLRLTRSTAPTTNVSSARRSLMAFVSGGTGNLSEEATPGDSAAVNQSDDWSEQQMAAAATGSGVLNTTSTGSTRRGQPYSRKLADAKDAYVVLEDRVAMLTKERERMKQQKDKEERDNDHLRDLFRATVEEAVNRMKELRLEELQFNREVICEATGTASADDLLRYMNNRHGAQGKYLDKLNAQCAAAERSILQHQRNLKQRRAAGEAFHAIDFEQLRIENQKFVERIERKNLELVELKGTSTRTVQTLNNLMDTLNGLTSEQSRLRKDYKNRCEYLARLKREMVSVAQEAKVAEQKNTAIKLRHEAVRVPKIENYMAQKAEEYELRKAQRNWQRKVEIAEGQLGLMKQQIRVLVNATDAQRRRKRLLAHQRSTASTKHSVHGRRTSVSGETRTANFACPDGTIDVQVQQEPVVGGSKGLLDMKRRQ
ncbi:hypothetical protein, conserved [Trypanosoma brucei gambiense DAL972]|uniref:Cilia- and flagella-associated protein 263 n=2 Tax=Trypanosoma brucei TaxID=5691 RepID=C9ZT07_TRYB9|nr:hypothetical protein, conserved [Trypanosoma brucei gambiense DAL972]RHW71491.1 hypothetical protein DPX39_070051200 [Trypanosoma brucei equiperdum]CBH12542.1 hypothetical protein, conserved [Trypanosoma brucei gambiense DAL972]|eukprot:XP_011774822.1 hypothetical protein, conserved [Trypanosoma brucei gambiense DAL972]